MSDAKTELIAVIEAICIAPKVRNHSRSAHEIKLTLQKPYSWARNKAKWEVERARHRLDHDYWRATWFYQYKGEYDFVRWFEQAMAHVPGQEPE